jgi:hypothetical protein
MIRSFTDDVNPLVQIGAVVIDNSAKEVRS